MHFLGACLGRSILPSRCPPLPLTVRISHVFSLRVVLPCFLLPPCSIPGPAPPWDFLLESPRSLLAWPWLGNRRRKADGIKREKKERRKEANEEGTEWLPYSRSEDRECAPHPSAASFVTLCPRVWPRVGKIRVSWDLLPSQSPAHLTSVSRGQPVWEDV